MSEPGPRAVLLEKAIAWFAANGVRDTSLRSLAAAIGTSQRMLHYHFGSREDLLAAVVEAACAADAAALADQVETCDDPFEAAARNWERVAGTSQAFGPLFFELSSHAMYGKEYAARLRDLQTRAWVAAFRRLFQQVADAGRADLLARLSLAVGRGVLFELALTGDRATADAVVAEYTAMVRSAVADSGAVG